MALLTPEARRPRSSSATIMVIAALIGLVISGFAFIAQQQQKLGDLRESSRTMRMARQAIMEADTSILNALVQTEEAPDLALYHAAMARLAKHASADFPPTVTRNGVTTPALPVIDALKATWAEMIPLIGRGQFGEARNTYLAQAVQPKMEALIAGFVSDLDKTEAAYTRAQGQFDLAVYAVAMLQILIGIVCIVAFVLASWNGTRESEARELAISTANASREQVSRLFQMTDMLQSASDYADADAVLKATAAELIPGFGGALYVFNNSRDRLTLSTSWGLSSDASLPDTIGLQQCWSLKRGKPHVNRPNSHKLCCEHFSGPDCALEIPMIARGEILGLLQIYAGGEDAEGRLAEVASLGAALADAMSLALANIGLRDKLRSQALRDPLTGLYNRRYMEDTLERVVRLAERDKHDVSVIMIDLDHFKRLNDQYGHAKGDAVLRDAGAILMNQLRETDVACRYGGEELIVVLPNCGIEVASLKAERMRVSIEALSEPNGAQVSASFGVAAVPTTSVATKDLLASADAALYRAKQDGRNRVVRATPRPGQSPLELLPENRFRIAAE